MNTRCPHCDRVLGQSPQLVGQRVSCPYCDTPFIMPELRQLTLPAVSTQIAPLIRTDVRFIDAPRRKLAVTIYLSAVLMGAIFVALGWASPPPVDLLQYIGLIGIAGCIGLWLFNVLPKPSAWRPIAMCLGTAVAVAGIGAWAYCDTRELVTNKGKFRVTETSRRFWLEILYRKVDFYSDDGNWVGTIEGPTSPESGSPHGHWHGITVAWETIDTWYWYGQEVTEGEWQRRMRGG